MRKISQARHIGTSEVGGAPIPVTRRKHGFRVDWCETTPTHRLLLLYDSRQTAVARARVPLRHINPNVLAELAYQLEDVFGEGWMD